jgi:hypothetical protein
MHLLTALLLEKWSCTALQGNGPHILLTDGRLDSTSTVTTNVPIANRQVLYCTVLTDRLQFKDASSPQVRI